jgi:hypothetical protein
MASAKQVEANRRNAQRSTGPRTDRGKAIARLNALKHGLRTQKVTVAPGEDPELYRALLINLVDEYQPETTTQIELVGRLGDLGWLARRARTRLNELVIDIRRLSALHPIEERPAKIHNHIREMKIELDKVQRYDSTIQRDRDRAVRAIETNRKMHERRAKLEQEWAEEENAPNEPNFVATNEMEKACAADPLPVQPSNDEPIEPEAEPETVDTQNAPNEANSEAKLLENRLARRAREAKKRKRLLQKAARKRQAKR